MNRLTGDQTRGLGAVGADPPQPLLLAGAEL